MGKQHHNPPTPTPNRQSFNLTSYPFILLGSENARTTQLSGTSLNDESIYNGPGYRRQNSRLLRYIVRILSISRLLRYIVHILSISRLLRYIVHILSISRLLRYIVHILSISRLLRYIVHILSISRLLRYIVHILSISRLLRYIVHILSISRLLRYIVYILSISRLLRYIVHILSISRLLRYIVHILGISRLLRYIVHILSISRLLRYIVHILSINRLLRYIVHILSTSRLLIPRLFYHRQRTPNPPTRSPVAIPTTLYIVNTHKVTTTVSSNNRHLTVKHTAYFGYIQGFPSIAAFSMAVLPHRYPATPPGHPVIAVVFPTEVK